MRLLKEQVEDCIGREVINFENIAIPLSNDKCVRGVVPYYDKEDKYQGAFFAFLYGKDISNRSETLALNRIKFKIEDYLNEHERRES